ncbi:hypothetical protein [Cohnella fermenti]|uniref:Uncharacterized protein n=1 Tax=Cohnella fermenti TaxID=2565925 RepID=A0A4S4BK79_9BACL|nr:hypothetical protein [Cohnella fermenti]THF75116.1 hypothetical protein E6C55_22795 [Cohnella fermenti]
MSENAVEREKKPEKQEAGEREVETVQADVRPILIWDSEATFSVIPLGERGQLEAPKLRVFTSGFGQSAAWRSKPGSGPSASARCAA